MDGLGAIENLLFLGAFALFILLLVLEKRQPYAPVSRASLKHSFSTNTTAFLFNNVVMSLLSLSSLLLVAANYSQYGLLSGMSDGPLKWLLSFLLFDFAVYVWHFLGHKYEQLWILHKVHHSDKIFHVSTGLRFHIFDQALEVLFKCLCTIAFGVPGKIVVVCEVLRMFFVLFHHSNLRIPAEKWISYAIITPSLHRAHHSALRCEHDSNYGIVLAIWDLIFGTRKELVPKAIGLDLIEAESFVQLFSLAFVTERKFARLLHVLPRRRVDTYDRG
jgi:sterol desaturase/sphingolipid hydroxylase (fatty acid hydroxylase superfamily)